MDADTIRRCLVADDYLGDAPRRARRLANQLRGAVAPSEGT
jgi:hypothetical protein